MKKIVFIGIILGILSNPLMAALSVQFQGAGYIPKKDTQVSTIQLTKNGDAFLPGEVNFALPENSKLISSGLIVDAFGPSIKVLCHSDATQNWTLMIQSAGFFLADNPRVTIPLEDFQWAAFYAGVDKNGTWIGSDTSTVLLNNLKQRSFIAFSGGAQTVYSSDITSIDVNHSAFNNYVGTQVNVSLAVIVPANQQAGKYRATVSFMLNNQ